MKRTEREHLKEDPFQHFVENTYGKLQKYRKVILSGIIAVVAVVLIIVVIGFLKSGSISTENEIYSEALSIKNNTELTVDQKIEKLSKLEIKSGISSSTWLFMAALHFEKGDLKKAEEILKVFPHTSSKLIEDQKRVLEAEVLAASGKHREALELLNKLFSDPQAEVGKDFILFKMAQMQVKTGQKEAAVTNLKKLIEDYPRSMYSYEARTLLSQLEK